MKHSAIFPAAGVLRLGFILVAFCFWGSPTTRAGLTVDVHLYENSLGYSCYAYLNPDNNSPAFPDGYYTVASPEMPGSGSELEYFATNDTLSFVTGYSSFYSDFGSFMYGITNGEWSISVTSDTSTNLYTFAVTVSGITSDVFGPLAAPVFPDNGSMFVGNQPVFQWVGPTNWAGTLSVSESFVDANGEFHFESVTDLAPDQTSWPCPLVLPDGTNDYFVDYSSNATAAVLASTPVNAADQPISAWTSTAHMEDSFDENVLFTVGPQPQTNLAAVHTLVADYTFDNSGYLGQDSSTNGNNMDGESWWGPAQLFSTNAEAGPGAVEFFGTSCLTPEGQVLTNIDGVLAGNFTFSGWVNTTNAVGADGDDASLGATIYWAFNEHGATNDTIPLAITGSKAAFTTRDHQGNFTTIHSLTSVNDGTYHLLTVSRNQANGEMRLYVDGNLESSAFGSTDPLNGNDDFISIGGTTESSYTGLLDDLQIYSGLLDDGDVAELYNNPGVTVPNVAAPIPDFNASLGTTNLDWVTSGGSSWFTETTNTLGSEPAAQSGSISGSQSSTLSVTIVGPGTLTFCWSSIANDPNQGFNCVFAVDGADSDEISGDTLWYQDGPFTIPTGQHTLTWTSFAGGDTDPTEAAFLDQVNYLQNTAPVITLNPFAQTNYPGYGVALLAAATNAFGLPVTWQWFEAGDSSPISAATNSFYIPPDSGTTNAAGSYYAVASTTGGSVNTTTALVSFVSSSLPPQWSYASKSPFAGMDPATVTKDCYLGCAVDPAGDVYAAAEYIGDMDVLTNGLVENVLTSVGNGGGAALVKYAFNGAPLWAVGLTNDATDSSSYGVAVAPAPGEGAYLASIISGTNWLGTNQFVDVAGSSIVLSRFDANGSNVWSQIMSGSNAVAMNYGMLAADSCGNVTLAGDFSGTASFGGTNLSATGGAGFLIQFDTNGAVRWAQTVPDYARGLAYGNGQLYVSIQAAVSGGVTNVSVGGLSNVTDRAWAVACLSADTGQAQWLSGVGEVFAANTNGLIADEPFVSASGTNVFITGNAFGTSAVFGDLAVSLPGRGQYVVRYDTDGNPQTAVAFGNPTTAIRASAANDSGVYVCGDFNDYTQFGSDIIAAPVNGTNDLGPLNFTQPFIAKFDNDGNVLWARDGVSSDYANFRGIALAVDGVWADGFLRILNSVPAQFDTNLVFSDSQTIGAVAGGSTSLIWNQGGLLAKITDSSPVGLPVQLLAPQENGTSFQFQFLSQGGFSYNILYQTNLVSGNWETNSTVSGDGTIQTISVPLSVFGSSQQGYIRVSTQ
jgi:hypothetical protein